MLPRPRWNLRVASVGRDRSTVFVRKHQFSVGAPLHFDEQYGDITCLEYVLGALGAELVNGLRALADRRRVEIDAAEAVVHGELNDALAHIGVVGQTGHPGIERVEVRVFVSSLEDEDVVRKVWEELLDKSPLVRTLKGAIKLELTIKIST